jgi:4-hydroxy-tetrahydrodipicolinate reductase
MIKLAITGATGRMGQMTLREATQCQDVDVVGALTRPGNPLVGQDIGTLLGEDPLNIFITASPQEAFLKADVVIDFSRPDALESTLDAALDQEKPYIVCVTGLSDSQKTNLKKASQKIPLIVAPNTSLGIALLRKMAVMAAEVLGPAYDISILEMHHRYKADAPSGTSLSIAHALMNLEHLRENAAPFPSLSPRPVGTIECAVMRGGGVGGDHAVLLAGDKDLIRLEHRTLDPTLFAQGALKAALWLVGKPAGLYSMDDVVGMDS